MYGTGKIRNISFVGVTDPGYRAFCAEQCLRNMHLTDQKGTRSFADLLSAQLEKTVRHWLSGTERRILTWEYLCQDNRYRRYFREIDFIIEQDGVCMLGELKVSASSHAGTRAHRQLLDSLAIVRRTGCPVSLCFIWVNLGFGRLHYPMGQFHPDFSKVEFTVQRSGGHHFTFLQLRPQELFEWGLSHQVITDQTLLRQALQESRERHCLATLQRQLRWMAIPYDLWPEALLPKSECISNKMVSFGGYQTQTLLGYKLSQALDQKK